MKSDKIICIAVVIAVIIISIIAVKSQVNISNKSNDDIINTDIENEDINNEDNKQDNLKNNMLAISLFDSTATADFENLKLYFTGYKDTNDDFYNYTLELYCGDKKVEGSVFSDPNNFVISFPPRSGTTAWDTTINCPSADILSGGIITRNWGIRPSTARMTI